MIEALAQGYTADAGKAPDKFAFHSTVSLPEPAIPIPPPGRLERRRYQCQR